MAGGADARDDPGTGPGDPALRCRIPDYCTQEKSRYSIWQHSGASYAMTRYA